MANEIIKRTDVLFFFYFRSTSESSLTSGFDEKSIDSIFDAPLRLVIYFFIPPKIFSLLMMK